MTNVTMSGLSDINDDINELDTLFEYASTHMKNAKLHEENAESVAYHIKQQLKKSQNSNPKSKLCSRPTESPINFSINNIISGDAFSGIPCFFCEVGKFFNRFVGNFYIVVVLYFILYIIPLTDGNFVQKCRSLMPYAFCIYLIYDFVVSVVRPCT